MAKKKARARKKARPRKRNAGPFSFRKTKKALKKAGHPIKSSKRRKYIMRPGSASSEAARVLMGRPRQNPRRGKQNRWYAVPRSGGVKFRMRRAKGKLVVDFKK